jgi:hypothetical protein
VLVVKVEIWPGGSFDRAFEISRIGIANVSNLAEVSDYEMTALLDRDKDETVLCSEINSHERNLGWTPLVKRAMTNIFLADRLSRPGAYDDQVAELLRRGRRV